MKIETGIMAVPICPTCHAKGELVALLLHNGVKNPDNVVGFICSKDSTHWEIFELKRGV